MTSPAVLHHELVTAPESEPRAWMLLTHGIYGAGMNWRGIARKLVGRRPEWGVALVDLRQHGKSPAGDPLHTLAACAADLHAAAQQLGATVVAGHSFGGKVALVARRLADSSLRQTWVLDATPSPMPDAATSPTNTVSRVLDLMTRLPRTWARRDDFAAAIQADGHDASLAQWLAMSVVSQPDGSLALRFDLDALRAMLADYYLQDAWDAVLAPSPGTVELVIADRSSTWGPADRARISPPQPPHVHVQHIAAGHWLHIDAPAAVVEAFASQLPPA
jgi:pimeloyl-ACP methyl ester carboxylesterase